MPWKPLPPALNRPIPLRALELHVVPILLGGGERLFAGVGPNVRLEQLRAIEAPGVTHLRYRVVK